MSKIHVDKQLLIDMLTWCRPAYSDAEGDFCVVYLEPYFGKPDVHGNYVKIIGDTPNVCFTAHTDTVHRHEGLQTLAIANDIVTTVDGNCLGADCTTGLWLMLGMMEAGVAGVYVAHAAEEIGGIGSTALVKDNPPWLDYLDFVISFDRYGTNSIITSQSGMVTASDDFAHDLSGILGMPKMMPDPTGTYTDSYEYAEVVSECTNISVGYYNQHTVKESQDLVFAQTLLENLCTANWGSLVAYRDPTALVASCGWRTDVNYTTSDANAIDALERMVIDRPAMIAEMLFDYGFNVSAICDEQGLSCSDLDLYQGFDDFRYGYNPY